MKLRGPGRTAHVRGFADLPLGLRQLIDASYALSDRIFQLDRAMEVVLDQAQVTDNPVGAQVTRLEEAFSKPRRRPRLAERAIAKASAEFTGRRCR